MGICWGFLIVVGFCAVGSLLTWHIRRNSRWRVTQARPAQSKRQLWQTYYANEGIGEGEFVEMWREIARRAQVDVSRLLPQDTWKSFADSLPWAMKFDGESEDLLYWLKAECKKVGLDYTWEELATADACVRAMLELRKRSKPSTNS